MSILAVTGHRPERLGNMAALAGRVETVFEELKPTLFIQGMADGADLLSAAVALKKQIPVLSVRPWRGHTPGADWEALYARVLKESKKVVTLDSSQQYPGPWVYHKRNHYMVDHCDMLLAIWDGAHKGGTAATVRYAENREKTIRFLSV